MLKLIYNRGLLGIGMCRPAYLFRMARGESLMKFRLLVKLSELILGKVYSDDAPRADMYLPIWILALALVLFLGAVGMAVYAIVTLSVGFGIAALCCLGLGAAALLCWKNQTINMLSDDSFEYSTFLGNKKVYRFEDIVGLKRNSDSMTLIVNGGKVHIESCAQLTERFAERINEQLSGNSETTD